MVLRKSIPTSAGLLLVDAKVSLTTAISESRFTPQGLLNHLRSVTGKYVGSSQQINLQLIYNSW